MTDFNGKNVLITGAASGIGRLMAVRIAALGGRLILWDVNQQGLETLAAELKQKNYPVAIYTCDLSDKDAIYAAADKARAENGPIDVLINNAGIVSGKPLLEASDADITRTFAVNSMALFWTTRAFMPDMIKRNSGHIVTIASAAGLVGTPRLIDYCSSKFAAVGYDDALRMEIKRQGYNINTTVVCPYFINTGMFQGAKTRFPLLLPILEPDYVADKIIKAIQSNRHRLIMPRFVHTTYLVRLFPMSVFDALMGFFGINKSMDEFTGRPGH